MNGKYKIELLKYKISILMTTSKKYPNRLTGKGVVSKIGHYNI